MQIGLDRDRRLDERLERRVRRMGRPGCVDEVRGAGSGRACGDGPTASRALGYQQLLALLDGADDRGQAVARDDRPATRRFVRRQRSWFRRDHRMIDLDAACARPAGPSGAAVAAAP